jgi:hypothetical protein
MTSSMIAARSSPETSAWRDTSALSAANASPEES